MQDRTGHPITRLLLIENANSGGGNEWDAESFINAAHEAGLTIRHEKPETPEHCRKIIHHTHDVDAIAVAGGDGTINGALPDILQCGLPLLVLPAGTANDFARSLDLPGDPALLGRMATGGQVMAVDVGYANDRPFLNAASIGMTNRISKLQTTERKKKWGILSYAISAIEAALTTRTFRVRIENRNSNGRQHNLRCIQLLVGNGRYYGGGMSVHADATLTDGTLHLHAVVPRTLFGMALLLPFLKWGRTDLAPEVLCDAGQEISINVTPTHEVYADGECVTKTPVTFRVEPHALRVIVPTSTIMAKSERNQK